MNLKGCIYGASTSLALNVALLIGDAWAAPHHDDPFPILQQPSNVAADLNATVVLTVVPEGDPTAYNYQWLVNGIDLTNRPGLQGVTSPRLAIKKLQYSDGGSYSVIVERNSDRAALTSDSALVRVKYPDIEPQDSGEVISTNSPKGTIQWDTTHSSKHTPPNRPRGATWMEWNAPANGIASVKTAGSSFDTQLAIYEVKGPNSRLVTTNDNGALFYASATAFNARKGAHYLLAVTGQPYSMDDPGEGHAVLTWSLEKTTDLTPEIRVQPESKIFGEGLPASVRFEVEVRGVPTNKLDYQWWVEGKPVGPHLSYLDVDHPSLKHIGLYSVTITNRQNGRGVTSDAAVLAQVGGGHMSTPTYTAGPLTWPTTGFAGSSTCCSNKFSRYKVFLYFDGPGVMPTSAFPNPGGDKTDLTISTVRPENIGRDTAVAIRENLGSSYVCNNDVDDGLLSRTNCPVDISKKYRVGIYFKNVRTVAGGASRIWFDWDYK